MSNVVRSVRDGVRGVSDVVWCEGCGEGCEGATYLTTSPPLSLALAAASRLTQSFRWLALRFGLRFASSF